MADVTGPISTLPNSGHHVPDGTMCDDHPDRPAVARIQGETDSFGSEMHDMCEECLDEYSAYLRSEQAEEDSSGTCDWCKQFAKGLRPKRDPEEGMAGPVYYVCSPCIKKYNDYWEQEARYDDNNYFGDDYDDFVESECWNCGGDGYVFDCIDGCCEDADVGCDLCTRRCDVCKPRTPSPETKTGGVQKQNSGDYR